jgi:hypothetical protein
MYVWGNIRRNLFFPPLRHLWIMFSSNVTYDSLKCRVPPLFTTSFFRNRF